MSVDWEKKKKYSFHFTNIKGIFKGIFGDWYPRRAAATQNQRTTSVWSRGQGQPWLQWAWDCRVSDPGRSNKTKNRITTIDFRWDLLGRICGKWPWRAEVQKSWLIFKGSCLRAQELPLECSGSWATVAESQHGEHGGPEWT